MTAKVIQGFFQDGPVHPLSSGVQRLEQPGTSKPPAPSWGRPPSMVKPKTTPHPSGPPTPAFARQSPVAQEKTLIRPRGAPVPACIPLRCVAQTRRTDGSFAVDPGWLGLVSGGGKPLPDAVRQQMEAALGSDFSAVRVHVGPQADRIGAVAFTTGNDIYFAPGRYQPDTVLGKQLLGHELAHVIQQQKGRVKTCINVGVAVVLDHALELEADRMGQRAAAFVRQQPSPSGPPLKAIRPGSNAAKQPSGSLISRISKSPTRRVQRAIGMEIEWPMGVCNQQAALPGDLELAYTDHVKVVTDKNPFTGSLLSSNNLPSCLEFVVKHFDEMAGSDEEIQQTLSARLESIKTFMTQVQILTSGHTKPTTLGAVVSASVGWTLKEAKFASYEVNPKVQNGPLADRGYVQITLGVRLDKFEVFEKEVIGGPVTFTDGNFHFTYNQLATKEAARTGILLADKLADKFVSDTGKMIDRPQLKGFLALLFTQASAFNAYTHAKDTGQIKNYTQVLSRVNLGSVQQSLPGSTRQWCSNNVNTILDAFASPETYGLSQHEWHGDDTRQMTNKPAITLDDFVTKALKGEIVDQQHVFGGMKVVGLEQVGNSPGVPLELRAVKKQFMTPAEWHDVARRLILWSRNRQRSP